MSYEIHSEEELEDWEHEHQFRLVWKCPECDYRYEAERHVNEALKCPDCDMRCISVGETYLG